MTEKTHTHDGVFQPELDFGVDFAPNTPPEESRDIKRKVSFHPEVDAALNDVWDKLTHDQKVHLEPKFSDDLFYIAQLRALELETLRGLDNAPVFTPGLPFEQDTTASSDLVGLRAQDDLNRIIPSGIRENRLAVSTFMLTALIPPEQRPFPYYDDDEEVLVSGMFKKFVYDNYADKRTLVVALHRPKILEPTYLRDLSVTSVKVPVLGIGDWEYDQTA